MKAKLYKFEDKLEIRFSDDTLYYPKKGESEEDFVERIKTVAIDEYLEDEFDLLTIDKTVVETNNDADLQEAFTKAEGLQKKLIESVLTDRGLMNAKKAGTSTRVKVEKQSAEDMKASDHYKEHEANIGKYASFSPFKKTEVYEGKIAGVALNKTNTIVYYTIVEADGKRRCCAVLNETLKFIDPPKTEAKTEDKKGVAKTEETPVAEGSTETKTTTTTTTKGKKNQTGNAPGATGADKK